MIHDPDNPRWRPLTDEAEALRDHVDTTMALARDAAAECADFVASGIRIAHLLDHLEARLDRERTWSSQIIERIGKGE